MAVLVLLSTFPEPRQFGHRCLILSRNPRLMSPASGRNIHRNNIIDQGLVEVANRSEGKGGTSKQQDSLPKQCHCLIRRKIPILFMFLYDLAVKIPCRSPIGNAKRR
jgi:hypothetical protein